MKISGEPIANLVASTSGTASDWVVERIDFYPDEVAVDAVMRGYQFMVAADIFRGQYRGKQRPGAQRWRWRFSTWIRSEESRLPEKRILL